jgi:hypothetical protein
MGNADKASSLSHSHSLDDLADFWDTHDATDFDTQTHEVALEFDLKTRRHYVAIDPDVLAEVREAAAARGLSIESLANLWLQERALSARAKATAVAEARAKYDARNDE